MMKRTIAACVLALAVSPALADGFPSEAVEDLTIDREEVYVFTKKPTVTREDGRIIIRFTSKGYCDVAVAIEDGNGRILRHLVYGVLGANAPDPFTEDSLKQEIVWDGKDDSGRPVADRSKLSVRVSLGLKARLERTLFWHPKKRIGYTYNPLMVAQPEGVYVYEGAAVETIKLFGHDGKYIRTVYPFPTDDIKHVRGLEWHTWPDGHKAALHKPGLDNDRAHQTFLFAGADRVPRGLGYGSSAMSMAVHDGSIALVSGQWTHARRAPARLNRLGVGKALTAHVLEHPAEEIMPFPPSSVAFSPDKQWLYSTGSIKSDEKPRHAVYRMAFDGTGPAKPWLGDVDTPGEEDGHFYLPAGVCVDAEGRVYVADHFNDHVQVFSPGGELLKSVPVRGPSILQMHHRTQELYAFAFPIATERWEVPFRKVPPLLSVFDPFKSAQPVKEIALPFEIHPRKGESNYDRIPLLWSWQENDHLQFRVTLDSYTDPPTLWMCTHHFGGPARNGWQDRQVSRYRIDGDTLVHLENWNDVVKESIQEIDFRRGQKRHMSVDPRTGFLYVEGATGDNGPSDFESLNRIDPETGEVSVIPLPMSCSNFSLDDEGHLYLRASGVVGRFDLDTLEEAPFEHGQPIKSAHAMYGGTRTDLKGGLWLERCAHGGESGGHYWQSGMDVNSRGQLVVGWDIRAVNNRRERKPLAPPPGFTWNGGVARTVFDRDGKMIVAEAIPNPARGYAARIDNRGDVYVLLGGRRKYDEGYVTLNSSGCAVKFRVGKGELPDTKWRMKGPGQHGNEYDIEGADWLFPLASYVTEGCPCWASTMELDHFGRSFVPEHHRGQFAVLDTNGNLITHIGRYGNVDDGKPLMPDPEGLRAEPSRPIGGDEVALAYANYAASHTDRRLFIFDGNNDCIRSVKLDYHVTERVALNSDG